MSTHTHTLHAYYTTHTDTTKSESSARQRHSQLGADVYGFSLALFCARFYSLSPVSRTHAGFHADPAVIIARLQHKLAAAATLLQRMGRSGDCGAKLQRSFENLSIDVLRHKVFVCFGYES